MDATRIVIARESAGAKPHRLSFSGKPHMVPAFVADESGRFCFSIFSVYSVCEALDADAVWLHAC